MATHQYDLVVVGVGPRWPWPLGRGTSHNTKERNHEHC
jgi:hypothetical protein